MALLGRTKGVLSQIVDDIKKIAFWSNIIVQFIFFGFYTVLRLMMLPILSTRTILKAIGKSADTSKIMMVF